MGIVYLGNLGVGLVLGPLLGGVLTETWEWRATQWFSWPPMEESFWFSSFSVCPKLVAIRDILIGPFRVLAYLRPSRPNSHNLHRQHSLRHLWPTQHILPIHLSRPPYSLSPTVVGCIYIPIGVGSLIGSVNGGKWSDSIMTRWREGMVGRIPRLLGLRDEEWSNR